MALIPSTFGFFFLSRLVVAIGAACAIPTSFTIVSETFKSDGLRNRAFSGLVVAVGIGGVLGSLSGSAFGDTGVWRPALAMPMIVLGVASLRFQRVLPIDRPDQSWRFLQPVSSLLLVAALATGFAALIEVPSQGWGGIVSPLRIGPLELQAGFPLTLALVGTSFACGVAFACVQIAARRLGEPPFVDPAILRFRRFRVGLALLVILTLTSSGLLSTLPVFNAFEFGADPARLGMTALVISAGLALGGLLAVPLLARLAVYRLIQLSMVVQICTVVLVLWLGGSHPNQITMLPFYLLFGLAIGLALGALNNIILRDLPNSDLPAATATSQTVSNLASGLATMIGTTVFVFVGEVVVKFVANDGDRSALERLAQMRTIAPTGLGPGTQIDESHFGALASPEISPLINQTSTVVIAQYLSIGALAIGFALISIYLAIALRDPGPTYPKSTTRP